MSSLEQRLLRAEQAEVELSQELREAEAHAHEQEGNLLRAAALEDRLKEFQAEQGQLDNYKQVHICSPTAVTSSHPCYYTVLVHDLLDSVTSL